MNYEHPWCITIISNDGSCGSTAYTKWEYSLTTAVFYLSNAEGSGNVIAVPREKVKKIVAVNRETGEVKVFEPKVSEIQFEEVKQ